MSSFATPMVPTAMEFCDKLTYKPCMTPSLPTRAVFTREESRRSLQNRNQTAGIMRSQRSRVTNVPDSGMLCDLQLSNPGRDVKGWGMNDRGVSYTFGPDKVAELLEKHDIDLVCRAHQVLEYGYEFFADRQLVTIFSAPNFCSKFDNSEAMISVDESLMCSFKILKPAKKKSKFMMSTKI